MVSAASSRLNANRVVRRSICFKRGPVQSLRASPDGRFLASCGDDGAIQIWEMENGDHVTILRRDRPYERLDITGIKGLTDAEKLTLKRMGAVEQSYTP